MDNSSGVGVLDKASLVLGALEAGPMTLAQLVASTHLARPTAHRLAVALEHHRFVSRDMQGRLDRKSTRLNSSHVSISYAVFCLKKKNKIYSRIHWKCNKRT